MNSVRCWRESDQEPAAAERCPTVQLKENESRLSNVFYKQQSE